MPPGAAITGSDAEAGRPVYRADWTRPPRAYSSWPRGVGLSNLRRMGIGAGILALLLVATVPALIEAGGSSLRGLGWLMVVIAAVVLLIDLTDRLGEWVERRRWGRRR